ncbi:phosphotransferase [Bacillus sp. 2205SS5-2]|uniref:phosphotransferase n=1 Tax=Bacillus sp. 2205SS5-2 TaxID=3109031 RepID=UPI003004A31E
MKLSEIQPQQYEQLHSEHSYWDEKIKAIAQKEQLPFETLCRFSYGGTIVYSLDERVVIKLFPSFDQQEFLIEQEILQHLKHHPLPVEVPELIGVGKFEGWSYVTMNQVEGNLLVELWDALSFNEKKLIACDLGLLIQKVHALPTGSLVESEIKWEQFITEQWIG